MSYVPRTHQSKLCCILQTIGKLYSQDICKECLKDAIMESKEGLGTVLELFTLNDKN